MDNPYKTLSDKVRKVTFSGGGQPWKKIFSPPSPGPGKTVNPRVAKLLLITSFLFVALKSVAPDSNTVMLLQPKPIEPFHELMYAIGMVETMGNVSAYNEFENAVGIFQIRQVRIDDYNRRTGNKYALEDMFNSELSEKVFLYFASQAGPYHLEKIARAWNGSGPMTDFYWKRIKTFL
jgi:hypothetical protein